MRLFLDWRVWLRGLLIVGGIVSILTASGPDPWPMSSALSRRADGAYLLSAWLLREFVLDSAGDCFWHLGFCGVILVGKPGFRIDAGP